MADSSIVWNVDASGNVIRIKAIDNGDGTYSLAVAEPSGVFAGLTDAQLRASPVPVTGPGVSGVSAANLMPVTPYSPSAVAASFLGDGSDNVGASGTASKQGVVARLTALGTSWDRLRTIQGAKSVSTGLGVLAVEAAGRPSMHITAANTTLVVTGAGFIESIDVCKGVAASTITVYDNTTGSGTVLGVIDSTNAQMGWLRNRAFSTGLTLVTSGATDVNVSYRN